MKAKPNTLADIKKTDRERLRILLYERSVARYSFSYKLLAKLLDSLDCPDLNGALAACIIGFSEDDTKAAVDDLNERIQAIYSTNDLRASETGAITVMEEDPFGRMKDFIYMQSKSSKFSQSEAIDALVRTFKLKAADVVSVFEAATHSKPYVTVQARDHKEGSEPHDRKPR